MRRRKPCYINGAGTVADFVHSCRLFGFLLGTTLAGASVYYYILEEYKVSNELLTEDIYVCYLRDFILAAQSPPRGWLTHALHTLSESAVSELKLIRPH